MPSIDLPDEATHAAMRFVLALYLAELYDDPDGCRMGWALIPWVERLRACATSLGFDLWDATSIHAICGIEPTAFEVQRLRDMVGA